MKWIMADKVLTMTLYDEEHEDHLQKRMTVEDILDKFTDEGCPTIYSSPAQQWIPCSERLPEDLEEINVTWVNHSPEPYYDFVKDKPFTASAVYYGGKWYWYSSVCVDILAEYGKNDTDEIDGAIEITAWMPLPKPYKEEQDG